ncbi:MAG: hypothetical protein QOI21_995 [Actinomycetota bacterium]|nr:hypothetical protein [Actinomycetota bacterium]
MSASDDELDAELRRLFGDERLALQPKADAPEAIVAGARRIKRRRVAMLSTSGAVVAVALVAGSLTFGPFRPQDNLVALSTGAMKTSEAQQTAAGTALPDTLSTTPPSSEVKPSASAPRGLPPDDTRATTTQPPAKTTSNPPKTEPKFVSTGPLLAADGFGMLKLGAPVEGSLASDVTMEPVPTSTACAGYNFSGDGVPATGFAAASNNYVAMIVPSGEVHTAEGIGTGSTKADVKQTYVGAVENASGFTAPAGPSSIYRFTLDGDVVQSIQLEKMNIDC